MLDWSAEAALPLQVSSWCDQLDLSVSIWYPAFFKSYSDPDLLAQVRGDIFHEAE